VENMDIEKNFKSIGKSTKNLASIYLISVGSLLLYLFFGYFGFYFSWIFDLDYDIIMIISRVISIFSVIAIGVTLIFKYISYRGIEEGFLAINTEINNFLIDYFCKNLKIARILKSIGGILLTIGFTVLVIDIFSYGFDFFLLFGLIATGGIINIVGSIFEISSWKKLESFIMENPMVFGEDVRYVLQSNLKFLQIGRYLLFSAFFFILTALVGIILLIVGYWKVGKILSYISDDSFRYDRITKKDQSISYCYHQSSMKVFSGQTEKSPIELNFCPKCGLEIKYMESNAQFCPKCGQNFHSALTSTIED
jgi:hypothetical protein